MTWDDLDERGDERINRVARKIADSFNKINVARAVAQDPISALEALLPALKPLLPNGITPEFRERMRLLGVKLRAFQAEEDRKFRPEMRQESVAAEPFDCSVLIGTQGRSAVATLLAKQCGTQRRKRLPDGPTRPGPAQGDSHGC